MPTAQVYQVGEPLSRAYARSSDGGTCMQTSWRAQAYALGRQVAEDWPRLRLTGSR